LIKERKGAMIILRSVNDERAELWNIDMPPLDETLRVRAEAIKGF
jgi:hypothetical protein